jgi:hypothetical protein
MKRRLPLAAAGALALATPAIGQGSFQNLSFEAAQIIYDLPNRIATSNALPGWQAFSGTDQLLHVHYNSPAAANIVGLLGSNAAVLSGTFSVSLSVGGSVAQAGLVPAGTESLRFKASWHSVPAVVSLGGHELPLVRLSETANYSLYGADVSAFAGQAARLSFASPLTAVNILVDDFEFSPLPIPEPSALALSGLGALCIAARWVHRRSKRGG